MKKNYTLVFALVLGLLYQTVAYSQCGSITNLGSATNMFTLIRNSTSSIAASKTLNTVAFIHRNDAAAFGGNSGQLRFDLSTNGGASWTNNLGVITPVNTRLSRYPNIAIYNPASNTSTTNAYIAYMAPTIDASTSAWNGVATGVSKFNVTGVTETYNQNGIGTTWQPSSMTTGSTGIFWALDVLSTSNGFNIYKGTWNSGSNDVSWSINYVISPTYNSLPSFVDMDFNIAFDPTGTYGWVCFAGHMSSGPTDPTIYPVLYKTTDGGTNWSGPIVVDVTKFGCVTSNTVSGSLPSMSPGSDLIVDVNGNPHIVTALGNSSSYVFNYTQWHHMYDITLKSGLWVAYDLGNALAGQYTPAAGASQWLSPQAARSADGTKIFCLWTDNTSYSLGSANSTPDLFGKAFNVTSGQWTPTKNFSSCNLSAAGKIFFPHVAQEVLEPSSSSFLVPTIYGEMTSNDPNFLANFRYLDNVTFASTDFSITPPAATVTISPPGPLLVCQNGSLTLSIGNIGQAIWSNSATTTSISISSGTVTTYSVIAQVGCNVGTASVAVSNMTVNAGGLVSSICPGDVATFTATGNALGYTWTPGPVTGTNVVLGPLSNNVVTLTAVGSGSCTDQKTVGITILPTPTINIVGTNTICAGTILSQTATGAQSYVWSDNSTSDTFTDTPLVNTSYTVTGTAANTCTNTQTVSVVVKPAPTLNLAYTQTAACVGETVGVLASGAVSYQWVGGPSTAAYNITASSTTAYSVTGTGTNQCQSTKVFSLTVFPIPNLTVTPARSKFCKGEKIKLTLTGANTYTWTTIGQISSTVQVSPVVTTTYIVVGKSSDGCKDTISYVLTVDPCTGIEANGISTFSVSVFPIPTKDNFTIKGDVAIEIQIFNELGQHVKTVSINEENQYEADIRGLEAGVYFLIGQSQDGSLRRKVIVTN